MASLSELGSFGKFVGRAAAGGLIAVSSVGLAACESPTPISTPTRPAVAGPLVPPSVATEQARQRELAPKPDAGKEYVISAIHELPSSEIKDLLIQRVEPLFKTPTPGTIDIGGILVPVYGSEVRIDYTSGTVVEGSSQARSDLVQNTPLVELREDARVYIPYLDLTRPDEIDSKAFSGVDKVGVPYLIATPPKGSQFHEGIWPDIRISTPNPNMMANRLDRERYGRLTKLIAVKEAATLLLHLLETEAMVGKMRESGYEPFLEVKRADGSIGQAEIVTNNLNALAAQNGRVTAAIDIGGFVLATKAAQGTQVWNESQKSDPRVVPLYEAVAKINLGTTPDDIRKNTLQAALTIQNIPRVYAGDLNKLP